MANNNLQTLEAEVWKSIEPLRNNTKARLAAREAFYKKYGQETQQQQYGFGDAEVAFLGWEERCVIRPLNETPPGSEWWNAVNLWFIFLAELGAKAVTTNFDVKALPAPAQLWSSFIIKPDAVTWYRAHNASIIDGYLKYTALAQKETMPEKVFINMVLYRLLFAQAMVEGQFVFPKLGKVLGDPRGAAVQFITGLDAYYPSHYPMNKEEIAEVLGKAHNLDELGVEVLDDVLIEPELTTLYMQAASWNQQEGLKALIVDHKPAYPDSVALPATKKSWLVRLLIWLRKLLKH